ncbi:LamG domain-containing protein [Streptomyces zaomyceticus]|uniref:LamG domain-containing protein n=1 Tax=Streptomyces zaomyceticus TaxID=68286 RepID=UPI003243DD28
MFSPLSGAAGAVAAAATPELERSGAVTAESAASELAAETGRQEEVLTRRTEVSQLFANPDGTFTQETNAAPVRARKADGSWAAIDTTLVGTGDGRVVAEATVSQVEFSGGGSGQPMATVSAAGKELSLGWPGPLPKPVLEGSTATYREVFPGVDLKLTAVESGFTQTLVVKSAEAAQNPALESVQLSMDGSGVRYTPGRDGGMRFVDEDGRTVFESPSGQMWDSSGDAPSAAKTPTQSAGVQTQMVAEDQSGPSAPPSEVHDGSTEEPFAAPSAGDKTADVTVAVTGDGLAVKPDLDLLRSDATVYPVYIDPPVTGLVRADWTALSSDGDRFWEFTGDKGVGYCSNYAGYLCSNTPYTQRMYFEYPLAPLHDKKILDATFEVYQTWSFTCTQHNYLLVRADENKGISSSTSWSSKPAYVDMMGDRWSALGRGALCDPAQPADWLRFSDNVAGGETDENMTPTLQSLADAKKSNLTLELRAQDESTTAAWARFRNDAKLSVTYVSKPDAPTSVGVRNGTTGRACNAAATPLVTSSQTPKMTAMVQSVDGPKAQLRALYEVWKADGSQKMWWAVSPDGAHVADNAVSDFVSPSLAVNTNYRMRVLTEAYYATDRGVSGHLQSLWSTWCYFRVDKDSPPPPVIKSADGLYPPAEDGLPAGAVGKAGKFSITPADTNPTAAGIQSDVTSYKWRLNSGAVSSPINVATGASTTVTVTPNQAGENTIQVWAYDAAMHSSVTGYYSFKVNGAEAPSGIWPLDNTGTDATPSATKRPLTPAGGATYTTKSRAGTHALQLDGTTGYATTATPPVDTSKSYSVSAWANIDPAETGGTVVGINGKVYSGFYLAYNNGYWSVLTSPLDTMEGNITQQVVVSKQPATKGVWTHVTAVYDAANQEMRLYVNGRLQGTDAMPSSWAATGGLQVGRGLWHSTYSGYFDGSVDEVRTWSRALADEEVAQIATQEDEDASDGRSGDPVTTNVGYWDARDEAMATGTSIQDVSGFGRTMTLNGATFANDPAVDPDTGETADQVMALDGAGNYASVTGPLVDETGSFTATTWVRLNGEKLQDTTKSYTVQVMGQAGTTNSSWGIWYEQPAGSSTGKWKLGRPNKDGTGASWTTAQSGAAVKDKWVRLTAVYDAQRATGTDDGDEATLGALFLYVDTAQVDGPNGVSYSAPWQGNGKLEIGRGLVGGVSQRYFPGHVQDARVWAGAMSPSAIGDLWATEQQ